MRRTKNPGAYAARLASIADKWTRHVFYLVVCASMLCPIAMARAAPPDPVLLVAKQTFTKEMKKKSAAARAAAVTTFAELIQPEVAELLLKRGIADDDATVRQAVQSGLRHLADDRNVRHFLSDELKKSFRKPIVNETTVELFRALVVTDDEERQTEIMKSLDDYLGSNKGQLIVPMTVIDDLAKQGDAEALTTVKLLATAKAFEQHFGYRRCIVQAMSQIREPDSVDFLIELLPKTRGLVQHDVIEYLTQLTKQKFRDNDRDWSTWWKNNRKEFQFPAAGVSLSEPTADDQQPTYYGIPICAKRIVFVLDTSGSMRGQPIEAAKQALLKAIESLPEAVSFDVITFDAQPVTWQPRLVPANREAKQAASQMVTDRGLRLGTASHSALNAAFELEPEAIYFLSDGEPTDGPPHQIVSTITQLNKTRRVSIHTIGVVTQQNGGIGLTMFMQPLSNQNYGKFRLVE